MVTSVAPSKLHSASINIILIFICLLVIIPIWLVVSISLSSEDSIMAEGFTLIPGEFSLTAYKMILANPPRIINAYGVSTIVTVSGTVIGLVIMSMASYALSRSIFKLRFVFTFFFFFTMLFRAGLVPFYIYLTQYLHLKNNLLVLIFPLMVNAFYILILRTYFKRLPLSLIESAKIDGAGEIRIFWQIIIPLSKPVLATVAFFLTMFYWNEWWMSLLFISDRRLFPLQMLLRQIMANIEVMRGEMASQLPPQMLSEVEVPSEAMRMAMCVVAAGPMMIFPLKRWPNAGNVYITYDKPETVKCYIYDPINLDDYKKTIEWVDKGYIRQDVVAITDNQAEARTGRYACGFIGGYLFDSTPSLTQRYGFPVKTIPLGEMVFDRRGPKATVNCISPNCKNPGKAMQFIELLNTDPYLYNLLVYGIEDEHYVKTGPNNIEPIDNSGYNNVGHRWVIGNTTNMYFPPGFDENMNKMAIQYSKDPVVEIHSDFSFNMEPIQDTATAWDTYVSDYIETLRVGIMPSNFSTVEEVFAYLAEEGKPYIDAELNEFKKQFNAYLEAKKNQ